MMSFRDSSPPPPCSPHSYLCFRPRNKYWGSHLQSQVLKVPLTKYILHRHSVASKSKCEHFRTTPCYTRKAPNTMLTSLLTRHPSESEHLDTLKALGCVCNVHVHSRRVPFPQKSLPSCTGAGELQANQPHFDTAASDGTCSRDCF